MQFRDATRDDVTQVIQLLADDVLGRQREQLTDPLPESYYAAFDALASHDSCLMVVEDAGCIIACLQLTFVPGLSFVGMWRAQIEAVHVASPYRGQGIGAALVERAIERARARGCGLMQLTSNKSRLDAHRFYQRLGFEMSHEGMKLFLGG